MTMIFTVTLGDDVSNETKSKIADIVISLQVSEDHIQLTHDEAIAQLDDYCSRPGTMLISGHIDDELVATTFILKATHSRSVKNNGVLKSILDSEGISNIDEIFISAEIYVIPQQRGNGYGSAIMSKAREVALENKYTHHMRMVYKNDTILNFLNHNRPLSDTTIKLKINDFMGGDIILESLSDAT